VTKALLGVGISVLEVLFTYSRKRHGRFLSCQFLSPFPLVMGVYDLLHQVNLP
jgi:hypothetical protein